MRYTSQPLGVAAKGRQLHYTGNWADALPGSIMGPNGIGEYFVCVNAEYDSATNTTTGYFRYATRADFENMVLA